MVRARYRPRPLLGVWNLHRAVRTVRVSPEDGIRAGRIARRWARAQGRIQSRWVQRVDQCTGRIRYRRSRTRVHLMTNGNRGWIATSSGPGLTARLALYLSTSQPSPWGYAEADPTMTLSVSRANSLHAGQDRIGS